MPCDIPNSILRVGGYLGRFLEGFRRFFCLVLVCGPGTGLDLGTSFSMPQYLAVSLSHKYANPKLSEVVTLSLYDRKRLGASYMLTSPCHGFVQELDKR